jgi:serine/threonine-protein kinase
MVMPSAAASADTTAETQVIGSRQRPAAALAPADSTAQLATVAARRKRRGWVLFAIIAVIALLAGGTGWYFGAGPGSRVTIPDSIAGMSIADATAALEKLGLTVDQTTGTIDSPTVPVDQVANTDPPFGTGVAPGSTVQLLLSTGPKQLPVPAFAGMSEADATAAVKAAPFTLKDTLHQFDATVAEGTVIDALAGDGSSLTGVATYGELQPVTLIVSAGPLPDLAGMSVDDATAKLKAVGLELGTINQAEFSDTVPQGNVIRAQGVDGATVIRTGDTVDLITSKGVELVTVPNVIGLTWADAKPQLEEAGFALDYNIFADAAPGLFTVTNLDPDENTDQPKGSTIKVNFSS